MSKPYLREILSADPDFQSLGTAAEQEEVVDFLYTNAEARKEYLSGLDDYNNLDPSEQDELLKLTGVVPPPIKPDWIRHIEKVSSPKKEGVDTAIVKRIAGGFAGATAGGLEAIVDTSKAVRNFFGLDGGISNVDKLIMGGVNKIREWGKEQYKESEELTKNYSATGKLAFETGTAVLESVPAILASIYTGSIIPGMVYGTVKHAATRYGRMKDVGATPLEAGTSAAVSGTGAAIVSGLSLKTAMSLGVPLLKRQAVAAAVDLFGGGVQNAAEVVMDYIWDQIQTDNENKLLDPNKDFGDHVKDIAWQTAIGVLSGQLTNFIPDVAARLKLKQQGLKAVDVGDNKAYIAPAEMADDIRPTVVNILQKDPTYDVQEVANMAIQRVAKHAEFYDNINQVKIQQQETPLDSLEDFQAKPKPLTRKVKSGEVVGLNPKYLKTDKPLNETVAASVVKNNGETVDLQIDGQLFKEVPLSELREAPKPRVKKGTESMFLTEFLRRMLTPDIAFVDMTADQAKARLGNLFATMQKDMPGLASVTPEGKNLKGKITWDALANNPDQAYRILSHDIGHIISQLAPEPAKKYGLESFMPFKKLFDEAIAKDLVTRQNMMAELNSFWDAWALFDDDTVKVKFDPKTGEPYGGNPKELLANAVSMFLNDADVTVEGLSFRDSETYKLFQKTIESDPQLQLAYEQLRATSENPEGSYLAAARSNIATADAAAKAVRDAKNKALTANIDEFIFSGLWDKYYVYLKALKHSPKAQDMVDSFTLGGGTDGEYIKRSMEDIILPLRNLGPNKIDVALEDFSVWLQANNVLNARKRVVNILKPGSEYESMDAYKLAYAELEQEARKNFLAENPNATPAEMTNYIRDFMKDFREGSTFQKEIQLLSPGGMDEESAAKTIADIDAKYARLGVPKISELMRDIKKNWHKHFKEWILPTLKESGLYSADRLKLMEENEDYVTFDIVSHAFDSAPKRSKRGTIGYFYERTGTLGVATDPIGATFERHTRMAAAARKTAFFRDMLSMVADEDIAGENVIRAVRDDDGALTPKPFDMEEITTYKYNEMTGKMEETIYYAKRKFVEPFESKTLTDNALFNVINSAHRYLKSWYTVYNPGFWMVNLFRDSFRTITNAPKNKGFIPDTTELIKSIASELINPDIEMQTEMTKENLLLGGGRRMDVQIGMSPTEKMITIAGMDIPKFTYLWKEVDTYTKGLRWAYEIVTNPRYSWKEMSAKLGGRTELATKVAMKKYLEKNFPQMPKEQKNWLIRNGAGTPNLMRQGYFSPWLSQAFMFFNPNIQGLASDFQLFMKDPKKAITSGMIAKRLMALAPYHAMIATAVSGGFGTYIQDLVQRISLESWMRGLVMPFGIAQDGNAVWATLPFDQITELVNTIMFTSWATLFAEDYTLPDAAGDIAANVKERVIPGTSPFVGLAKNIGEAIQAGTFEAMLDWRGQPVIPKDLHGTSHDWEKVKYVARHIANMGFLGPVTALSRIPYESKQLKIKDNKNSALLSHLIDIKSFPILNTTLGRFVKHGSHGKQQWNDLKYRNIRIGEANKRYEAKRAIVQMINNPDQPLPGDQLIAIVKAAGTSKRMLKNFKDILPAVKMDARYRVYLEGILYANTKAEREARILDLKEMIKKRVFK